MNEQLALFACFYAGIGALLTLGVTRRDYTHTRIQDYKALRYIRFCNARILRKQVEPQKYHSESAVVLKQRHLIPDRFSHFSCRRPHSILDDCA